MKCSWVSLIAILVQLQISWPARCNAEWIDKECHIVPSPGRQIPETPSTEGPYRFGLYGSKESKFGFKDDKGNIVIPAEFAEAGNFHNGLAPVFSGKKWSYVNQSGKVVLKVPNGCSYAGDFSEGLAAIVLRPGAKSDDRLPKRGDRLGYAVRLPWASNYFMQTT